MKRDHKAIVEEMQKLLKQNTKRYAFKKLDKEVIKTGACVECGSCVAACPVQAISGDRTDRKYVPILTGDCISCGICYAMCPRTFILQNQLIGEVKNSWKLQSTRDHIRQDGGAVTAILGYMLDERVIEGAVVTCQSSEKPWLPVATTINRREDLYKCGGTIYSHAQVIDEMLQGFQKNLSSLAVVGTACNIEAIHRMEAHPEGLFNIDRAASVFKISLFCMESFSYRDLVAFLKKAGIDIESVNHFAITGGELKVTLENDERSWPVAELNTASASSCAFCQDFTGKHSDLSCGNIGSDEGWTTVLVRTDRAEDIIKRALKKGVVRGETLDAESLQAVMNSARFKMNRYYHLQNGH